MFSQQSEFPTELNAPMRRRSDLLRAGRSIIDLASSNPTEVGLAFDPNWLDALGSKAALRYRPDPFGMMEPREALAARWQRLGFTLSPHRLLLSASTSEAYSHLFKLLCDPGDEVLVPRPSYPLFEHLAQLEHIRLSTYQLDYDGHWYIDLDSLRARCSPRTKAVILVSPNNPTGSITRRQELLAVADLGLPVISDEVFSSFRFAAARSRFCSALSLDQTLVFVLDGLSKSLGLPQCKLAWTSVTGPSRLVEAAIERLEVIADAYLSVATPIQCALPALLEHEDERRGLIQARLDENLATLRQLVTGTAATALHVDGGWSAVIQLPNTLCETDWVLSLLERDGIWVQPGWFFDFAREAYVVVSLLTPCEDFARGIDALVRRVEQSI